MREGWKEVELGSVIKKIIGGGTPSKANPTYWNGGIFWCSVKDMVTDSKYLYKTEDTISIKGLNNSASNLIPVGTVITATRMGLGRAFINAVEVAINQDLKALIPNEKINNVFLLYSILINKNIIEGLGTGATVKGIKLETLKSIKINLPPLETQKKIASILSSYDDLIENNLKRIKLLEEMAQQTYEEWFVRMRFPGYETATINPATGLPEGWEKGTLNDITGYLSGYAFKSAEFKDEGNGLIRIKNIGNNTIDLNDVAYIDNNYAAKQSKFLLKEGDLLIAMTGATVGKVGIMPISEKRYYLNQRVGKFVTDNTAFLNCFFNSTYGINQVVNIAGGAAQPNISAQQILDIELNVPEKKILKTFSENFNKNIQIIINLQSQNQRLREARDILLPRLMMGIVEV